jgi:hypothetical protein
MAFTFDHTLKGENSNSYVPLDSYDVDGHTAIGANDYFEGHPKFEKWDALSTTEKQQLLAKATSRINVETFGGRRSASEQRLQWPRTWVVSRDFTPTDDMLDFVNGAYYQSADYLPQEMEQATFELAMWYLEEWLDEDPLFSRGDQERMEQVSIGPLSATLRKEKEDALPDMVKRLLRAVGPGVWQGQGQIRVIR